MAETMFEALLDIGLLIIIAKVLEGILGRFGLSAIIAYTATGILLGPVTGIIQLNDPQLVGELDLFLNVGIFLFFFLVGLDELDLLSLRATVRGRFFLAAVISVIISMAVALFVTSDLFQVDFALNLDFSGALALSGILSLSSLGLVTKVLADSGHLKKPIGLEIFTVVIIAELIALLLIAFAIGERDHEPNLSSMLILVTHIVGFAVLAWVLSARVFPAAIVALDRHFNVPELSFGLIMGGLFLMVVAAEHMELHGSIGALLFGAALSGMPRHVYRAVIPGMRSAAEGLFVPLFFAAAGLRMDLSFLSLPVTTIAALAVIPFMGKFVGAFVGVYVARLSNPGANATGLMAKGVSEIALLLVLLEIGIIGQDVFSLFVLIMFGYILFMPSAITFAVSRAADVRHATLPEAVPPSFARHALDGMLVRHILDRSHGFANLDMSIREFAESWTVPNQTDYVVVENGVLAGVVSQARMTLIPKDSWADTPLARVLHRDAPRLGPEAHVEDALRLMERSSMSVVAVTERGSGKVLGTVTKDDVLELVMLLDEIATELEQSPESGEMVLERLGLLDDAADRMRRGNRNPGDE